MKILIEAEINDWGSEETISQLTNALDNFTSKYKIVVLSDDKDDDSFDPFDLSGPV